MGCIALVRCVCGVTLWFGCGGVVSVCSLRHWSAYLMLNMFRMLMRPSSGACDLFVELFHGLYCSGSMCVWCYVVVCLGWYGIRMQAEALKCLFNAQHVSDVNTSFLRSLRLICWVISWVVLLWFDVCVVLCCGLAVVVWYPYAGWGTEVLI